MPLGVSAALGLLVFAHGPRFYDDAYITFRYARNLAEGAGLVYNVGEPVLGTSAPALAVLLGLLERLTGREIPGLAYGLGVGCLFAVAHLGYRLARRVCGPVLSVLSVTLGLSPLESSRVFASGMETPLYLAGALLAVELACRSRLVAAFAVASGLAFVHPDAALLVPALLVALLTVGERPWRGLALGLVPAAVVALVLLYAYGSPVPHSVRAKRAAYRAPAGTALSSLAESVQDVVIARDLPRLLPGDRPRPALDLAVGLAAPVVLAALIATGLQRGRRRSLLRLEVLALGLFAGLYVLAFGLGNPFVFEWYRPPLTLAVAFVVAALVSARDGVSRVVWEALLVITVAVHVWRFSPYDPSGREEVYARAVAALAPGPADRIAAPEIGAVGWATRAPVLDTVGLVSPEALRFGPSPQGGNVAPRLLRETRATALISYTRFLAVVEREDPGALDGWSLVARLPAHAFGGDGEVRVYRRLAGSR